MSEPKAKADSTIDTVECMDILNDEALGEQIFEAERAYSLWTSIKAHKRILLHCSAAFFAGMVFGYDTIANGASISMPAFLIYFGSVTPTTGTLYLPSIWASLWTSMSALMQALGGFGIGFVSDKLGRKWTCVGACLISIAGVGAQYAATSRGLLLGGKMINGFAIGCLLATSTTWASEISPLQLRGPIQSAIVLFTTLMQAVGLVVIRCYVADISETSFREVFAIQWVWAVATAIIFAFMPESPTWLILNEKREEAKKSLARLYGSGNEINARFANLCKHIKQEEEIVQQHGTGGYLDAFKGADLPRTLTVMWIFIGTGFAGSSFLSQNVYFLRIAGLEPIHAYDVGIGGFGLAIVAIVASWSYMKKVGRRSLWLAGAAVNGAGMLVIGALYYDPSSRGLWAIAIIMNVLISWQVVTLTSTGWAITGEISSYRLRGKTQSVAVISLAFATWLFTFTVPYMYNVDAGNLGARAGFVFSGASILLFVISYFVIPELEGFAIEEIDWLYQNKIPVRHFQKYADGRAKEGVAAMALATAVDKASNNV